MTCRQLCARYALHSSETAHGRARKSVEACDNWMWRLNRLFPFAPRTRFGILARNLITRTLDLPFVAERVLGRGLVDRLALPDYDLPAQMMKSAAE